MRFPGNGALTAYHNAQTEAEIRKLKNQLSRAKKAYIEEIDTLEEYRENKVKLTAAIAEMEKKRDNADNPAFDPASFQKKMPFGGQATSIGFPCGPESRSRPCAH